jgi:(2Fe-2S) ferredoxin
MATHYNIYICNSVNPKINGVGCCGEKAPQALLQAILDFLENEEGNDHVSVKFTNCLRNCDKGISLKILPQHTLYGNVQPTDIPELLQSHIWEEKILRRLQIIEENRFLGF